MMIYFKEEGLQLEATSFLQQLAKSLAQNDW